MFKTRLIATASAVALSLAALSAPAFAATASTTAKHVTAVKHVTAAKQVKTIVHVHHHIVSGKIVAIDKPADMITLSNGKTYRVSAKALAKFKLGQHVKLQVL